MRWLKVGGSRIALGRSGQTSAKYIFVMRECGPSISSIVWNSLLVACGMVATVATALPLPGLKKEVAEWKREYRGEKSGGLECLPVDNILAQYFPLLRTPSYVSLSSISDPGIESDTCIQIRSKVSTLILEIIALGWAWALLIKNMLSLLHAGSVFW